MHRLVFAVSTALLAIGCGPLPIRGEGEEGKLRYKLSTDTSVPGASLDEVSIVAGTLQTVEADLTWSADLFADEEDDYQHALSEDCDASWDTGREDADRLPSLWVEAHGHDSCTLETWRDGRAYDRIALRFDDIDAIDVELRVYWPDEEGSEELEEIPQTLPVGSAVSLDPIPLAADGTALAGENDIEFSIETWAGLHIDFFDRLFGEPYLLDEPGLVSFLFLDERSGASARVSFIVVDEG